MTITTTTLPGGTTGVAYSANVIASGGTQPYSFTAAGLPNGLLMNQSGHIGGTPTAAGTSQVLVTVTDSSNPVQNATANFTIIVVPPPLTIVTSSLPSDVVGTPYSAIVGASGGTKPYSFSAVNLPPGLSIRANTGGISGTPTTVGTFNPTITATDSSNPTLTASATLGITITPVLPASLSVTNAPLGQGLQTPITITFNQPLPSAANVTVSSNNPDVLLSAHALDLGSGTLSLPNVNPADSPSFPLFVQSQGNTNSGTATITVSAAGYMSATGTITIGPAGFVLAGPNGVGASFNANQGSTTPLSISAEALDQSGNPIQIEQLRGINTCFPSPINPCTPQSLSVTVSLTSSAPPIGAAPASVTITSATDTGTTQFLANMTPGPATITANPPPGFIAPAQNANSVVVTVQQAKIITNTVTVGQGLENSTNFTLAATPSSNVLITLTSNDPTRLLLSTDPTMAGVAQICPAPACSTSITIPAGHSASPAFFVYGLGNSGTVGYTITATGGFSGTATGSVTLAPSGFVLHGPFGLGANFFTTTGGLPSQIDVFSALLDVNGNPVFDTFGNLISQPLAGGTSASVNVTSSLTSVGKITTSPVVFTGSNNDVSTQFTPLGPGTTVLAAVAPPGFTTPAQLASIDVTVSSPAIQVNTGTGVVGENLEQLVTLNLGAPAPANGLQVTLTGNPGGLIAFSSTPTGAGSPGLTLTVPASQFSANFDVYGLNSLGTATITATASGYTSGSGTIALAPSGIVIDSAFNLAGFPFSVSLAGGTVSIPVQTAVLNPSSSAFANTQPLAGGHTVSVSLTNSNNNAGTIVSPVTITGGSGSANLQFTPVAAGPSCLSNPTGNNCTTITAQRPLGGWQSPSTDNTLLIGVTN